MQIWKEVSIWRGWEGAADKQPRQQLMGAEHLPQATRCVQLFTPVCEGGANNSSILQMRKLRQSGGRDLPQRTQLLSDKAGTRTVILCISPITFQPCQEGARVLSIWARVSLCACVVIMVPKWGVQWGAEPWGALQQAADPRARPTQKSIMVRATCLTLRRGLWVPDEPQARLVTSGRPAQQPGPARKLGGGTTFAGEEVYQMQGF